MKHLITAILILTTVSAFSQDNSRYINVSGTAELTIQADQAEVNLQIKTVDMTASISKEKMDAALKTATDILSKNGVSGAAVSVSPVLFGKNYEYNERGRQMTGYYSMVTVNVLLKDLSKYFNLLNQLSDIEPLEIVSSSYSLSDMQKYNNSAYGRALQAARTKAENMAFEMGVKLGNIIEIDEVAPVQPFYYAPTANVQSRAESPDPAFSGKVAISKTIRVKFEIAK